MLQRYEKANEYKQALEKITPEVISCYKHYCDETVPEELERSIRAIIGSKADKYAKIKERKYLSPSEYRDGG